MQHALIESLRVEGGEVCLLPLHEERMARSLMALAPDSPLLRSLRLSGLLSMLHKHLPTPLPTSLCKLRFVYTPDELGDVSLSPYTPRQINRLVPIELPDGASYRYKWTDRSVLVRPLDLAEGEEPIYIQRGLLTDTSFSNVALRMEPDGAWLTPNTPLLEGVMRQHLLRLGAIRVASLTMSDLQEAHEVSLINALLPLGRCIVRP